MSVFVKLIDVLLFLGFLVIAVAAPLIHGQTCLPIDYFPEYLVDLKSRYSSQYGDYLLSEKPRFFLGLVWLELIFQWPLAVVNLYGILASKSWFTTTCLIYGVSFFTSMVAIMSELMRSGKASDNLLMVYYSFTGLAILAMLRGLLSCSGKSASNIKRAAKGRKKRA